MRLSRRLQRSPDSSAATGPLTVLLAHPSPDLYGSDRVLLETVRAIVDHGWEAVVTIPGPGPLSAEITAAGGRIVYCSTPIVRKSALKPLGFLRFVLDTLVSIPRSIGVVRSTGPAVILVNTITIPLWLVIARLTGRPTVCHLHEAEGSASRLLSKLLSVPMLLAHAVVANSEFSRSVAVRSWKRLATTIVVSYNGVAGPDEVTTARSTPTAPVRLLFLGRLSPRKGPDVAVRALTLLHQQGVDARLDLLGAVFPGYEWFEEQLRADAELAGVADRLTYHGFVKNIWPHVAAADVVIIPSIADEPFGNTAVEAVLGGRPVVVSDTSGLREATAGLRSAVTVRPDDAAAIASGIAGIVADWDEFRIAARADADTAHERYSVQRYQHEMMVILEKTRAKRHPQAMMDR